MNNKIEADPVVSIIVPVYNAEKYLKESIQSICRQTIKELQIILVEDGSSDHSFKVCLELAENDDRIEVYRQEKNKGVSAARNRGISAARGEYILFVDGDDIIDEDMVEILLCLMKECSQVDLAVCGYYIDDQPQSKKGCEKKKMERLEAAKEIAGINGSLLKGYVVNKLFKKQKIVEQNMLFDEETHICEDLLFCLQYVLHCNMINYDPIPKYHYITRTGSAMHGRVNEKRMSVLETYQKIIDAGTQYKDFELNELLQAGYWNHYVSILKDVVKDRTGSQKEYGDKVYPYIKCKTGVFLRSRYTTLKRKVLIIGLRIVYPFWKILLYKRD